MHDADGENIGAAFSALDATASTRADEALRKSEFLAILAHELRTPLATMRVATSMLRTEGIDAQARASTVAVLERQLAQMGRLVDDLLDVSRIGRAKLALRKEWIELDAVLTSAVEAVQPGCADRDQRLELSMPPESIRIHADPARLLQVVTNLLNNACKFTAPGGRIDLALARENEEAVIRVRDNGIGLAAEELPRVFDLFTQGSDALKHGGAGLGIGLTIARHLVEVHGGALDAYSAGRGQGSEFVVRLPLETEQPIPEPPASEAPAVAGARRILVVDDHPDAVQSLALLLEVSGHKAFTAHDGEEALATAAKVEPEVVLLDINLPRLDGYEVCRRLRNTPWGKDAVIVAVTGWAREHDRALARDAGFDTHLTKPVDLDALLRFLASDSRDFRVLNRSSAAE